MKELSAETLEHIKGAGREIKAGRVVAFPTETVYGLGADAFNSQAVREVFRLKQRPLFDPLIVHIASKNELDRVVSSMPKMAEKLIEKFWPGPLTLILPKSRNVSDIVTAGLSGVGVRMPNHPVALELLKCAETPIAAPSANKFGGISPTSAQHVREQFDEKVINIIDGGECAVGLESTIVSFMHDSPIMLRPGGIPLEWIESEIGPVVIAKSNELTTSSPGRSLRHYSPKTPLFLEDHVKQPHGGSYTGLLTFAPRDDMFQFDAVEVLSWNGNMEEAAANYFSALKRMDMAGMDRIVATLAPNYGLGRAINDRLTRACSKNLKG